MQGLRKLEQAQSIIELIKSNGIITSDDNCNPHAYRFLANLTLLLINPCGELEIDAKCQLISEHMPKFSAAYFEQVSQCVATEGSENRETSTSLYFYDDEASLGQTETNVEDIAMIELDGMIRANSTLEDFCRSYFMFHNMDPNQPQSIFRYLPVLSFTESYIYQLDTLNEKLVQLPTGEDSNMDIASTLETRQGWTAESTSMLKNDPFKPLVIQLEQHKLLTERIREELRRGEEYWSLERKLCCILTSNREMSIEDIMRAVHLKSFDYRVLNLLLYQLKEEKVNELHMEFLSISEFLVEVSDDLFDYEDDVLHNNFNILRLFVKIYGASKAPIMLAKVIAEAEEKYDRLLKALEPDLLAKYQKRCEDATREGGKTCGPPLGTWCIPSVIEDEDLYRSEISNSC